MRRAVSVLALGIAFAAAWAGGCSPGSTPTPESPSAGIREGIRRHATLIPTGLFQHPGASWAGSWKILDPSNEATWKAPRDGACADAGDVTVEDGALVLGAGGSITGVATRGQPPRMNYEVELEAQRVEGQDFFCGLTFPVRESYCTLILGGWGGGTVGLSNVDGFSADENETSSYVEFENGRWYRVRLRVTEDSIRAWIDDKEVIALDEPGERRFEIWWEQEPMRPLGVSTFETKGAVRNARLRLIDPRPVRPEE